MKTLSENFKNASFTLCGAASILPLRFLVQPVSVYLLIILVRAVGKLVCRKKWADITWEDISKI